MTCVLTVGDDDDAEKNGCKGLSSGHASGLRVGARGVNTGTEVTKYKVCTRTNVHA